jgi:hypothetical protein
MIRTANVLWVIFIAAPILYLLMAAIVTGESGGLNKNLNFLPLFLGLSVAGAASMSIVVYTQTSPKFMVLMGKLDPQRRTFNVLSTGSILSESLAIYGFVLTLLSGMLVYGLGFSAVAWVSLVWVRMRFSSNLQNSPDPAAGAVR